MNWIDRLERKYKKFAIRGLMKYLVIGSAIVFALAYMDTSGQVIDKLSLYIPEVLKGQVWRLVTFIFIPLNIIKYSIGDLIFLFFALYLFYIFGKGLEEYWGSFRLNLYYFIGVISAILAAFITQRGNAVFLNLSIFLAFAYLYPDFKLMVFFIIPVKVKYLAWFDVAFIVYSVAFSPLPDKVAAVLSFLNFFVFFGREIYEKWISPRAKKHIKKRKRSKFKVIVPDKPFEFIHKCRVCGRTSKDHPELTFGYCPMCGSDYEYCQDHLNDHRHFVN